MSNSTTADKPLIERASEAVLKAPHLLGQRLRCEAHDGQVTLHGVVSSYFQKQMAQETIRRVDGVTEIHNLLEVSWSQCQSANAENADAENGEVVEMA